MSSNTQVRTAVGPVRTLLVVVLALAVGVGVVLGYRALASPSSPGGSLLGALPGAGPGMADGVVPDGTTVFDDDVPAVANLDADLLAALRSAASAAADDGVGFTVNSGWRSPAYQDQLLREAVAEHGSAEEAARWVATADTSAHVSGDGVDVGPVRAMDWLTQHGDGYGLCRVYGNEPWHYELRPQAIDSGCPPMYRDPTEDPRMQP
jgi:D-alanyl-D-alanine carboxypeptidase